MTPEELDYILNAEDTLEPSATFAANVMASIYREADEPAPLRFPWWRFALGVAASGGSAFGATVLLLRSDLLSAAVPSSIAVMVYAFAMLLVSLGIAAVPRALGRP